MSEYDLGGAGCGGAPCAPLVEDEDEDEEEEDGGGEGGSCIVGSGKYESAPAGSRGLAPGVAARDTGAVGSR